MDEATSALDYQTERELCNRLQNWSQDRTVLFITHRLTTIKNSDVIFVMDKARVVESGKHSELMSLNGRYSTLYKQQVQARKDQFYFYWINKASEHNTGKFYKQTESAYSDNFFSTDQSIEEYYNSVLLFSLIDIYSPVVRHDFIVHHFDHFTKLTKNFIDG